MQKFKQKQKQKTLGNRNCLHVRSFTRMALCELVLNLSNTVSSSAQWEQQQKRPHSIIGRTQGNNEYKPVSTVARAK